MLRLALISLTIIFCLSIGIADAQNISDKAIRHFDRGQAAVEMANSPADYEDAIKEFEQAAKLAPDWPDVYYNLGLIQEKINSYDDAVINLKKYLDLSPNASDAIDIKRLITKLEYKMEKISEQAEIPELLEGTWQGWMVFCGGHLEEGLKFHTMNNKLFVRIPVTWHVDLAKRIDYKDFPVEREGKTIRFGFRAKFLLLSYNDESYCNVRYELKLTDANKLEGEQFQEGAPTKKISLSKITE